MQIHEVSTSGSLLSEFEDALLKQKMKHMHCLELEELKENHFNSLIQHRLKELEGNLTGSYIVFVPLFNKLYESYVCVLI